KTGGQLFARKLPFAPSCKQLSAKEFFANRLPLYRLRQIAIQSRVDLQTILSLTTAQTINKTVGVAHHPQGAIAP
ncbi:hypothetical protein, partial [Helicobacter typhlonius]|uniref:hypothetical protein n=1 Tax=Helicobacter typhlonius TaxID=76936 RepID=UPI002FE16406